MAGVTGWSALVLAGSRPGGDDLARRFGVATKALIPVGGEPMVRRPVRALEEARAAPVLVLTQDVAGVAAALPGAEVRPSQGTIAATILALCDDPATRWPLIVTTADHALLDAATVAEFCTAAAGADIAVGVVDRRALEARLPGTRRTWLSLRGEAVTGANLFALASPSVAPAVRLWRSVEQDRKKAWKLIGLLGPFWLGMAALRLASLDTLIEQLSRRLRLKLRAVRLANPLAGVDVDKPEDLDLVEAIIAGRQ
jgi:GTP:adenosylcobinamide-phosphate guanylyltransferase